MTEPVEELNRTVRGGSCRKDGPVTELNTLAAAFNDAQAQLAGQLEQKEITLALELEEIQIEGDRARLKEAIENLASNALRHCTQGDQIQVRLEQHKSQASLSVYNDGPAVTVEDLPHLFEPFYRGDKSHNRDSGGTGLGLAIVRAAVLAHGGDCCVENREGGVCFRIQLLLTAVNPSETRPTR